MRVNLQRENVSIEDISINVTCPAHGKSYNIQLKKPVMRHNCRCGEGQFHIVVVQVKGKSALDVSVAFEWNDGHAELVEPNSYEIEEP